MAALAEQRRGRQPVRPRPALRHQPAAPLVEQRQVLREHERTGGDAEADGEQHLRVVGAERRRPHEEHQRGRRGREPRCGVRTRASRRPRPSPTPRAPPAGWRRRWRVPGRARCAGGASRPRAGSRSRARWRSPGGPMRGGRRFEPRAPRTTASPTAARATPTHTDQPRHRTDAPIAWGSERGADHGQHEAARVDDPSERQRRHHAQRRRARAAPRSGRAGPSRAHRATPARGARQRLVPRGRERGAWTRRPRPPTHAARTRPAG